MNRFNWLIHRSAGGATALTWRYALVNYTFLSLNLHPFPLSAAILPIILAGVTTAWASGKGRRVISMLAIQLVSMALSGLAALYFQYPQTRPFWSYHWVLEWFNRPRDGQAWAVVALVLAAVVFFWWGGWFLSRRRHDPRSDFVRFDLGMSFFILLFLTKFLLKVRGDIFIEDPLAMPLFASFLIFGLIAIGATRQGERSEKQYLPGYAAIGSMAGFSIVIVLIGIGGTIVLMPYLIQAADAGYQAISAVAGPASRIITNLLRAMLSHKRNVDELPAAGKSQDPRLSGMAEEAYDGSAEWIMYLLTVLIAIALLFGIALVARWMIKWLMSRTAGDTAASKEMGLGAFLHWLITLAQRIRLKIQTLIESLKRPEKTGKYWYRRLMKWGRRSGITQADCETPREYGRRLKTRFPMLDNEMDTIVAGFNLEVYGGVPLDGTTMPLVQAAWRRLRSPRYWGRRLVGLVKRA